MSDFYNGMYEFSDIEDGYRALLKRTLPHLMEARDSYERGKALWLATDYLDLAQDCHELIEEIEEVVGDETNPMP